MTAVTQTDARGEFVVVYDDNRLVQELFGEFDQNLALVEQRLGVEAVARGNEVALSGSREALARARLALDLLYARLQEGHSLVPGDVDGAIRMATAAEAQLSLPSLEPKGRLTMAQIATRRRTVMARSPMQDAYIRAFDQAELIFGIGPAGTGKTYLAVAYAAAMLERGAVERLILSRPAVEAGERLGFLPGDMRDKVDPYLRPLYDALYDMMPADKVERGLQSGVIEVAPLAFMRGRTLANAVVILDEAQNSLPMQMKNVPDPIRRKRPHDRHRRSQPDRPSGGSDVRAERSGRPARRRCRHFGDRFYRRRCRSPSAGRAHRRGL